VTICTPALRWAQWPPWQLDKWDVNGHVVAVKEMAKLQQSKLAMAWNSAFEDMFSGVPLMIPVVASKVKPTHPAQHRAQPCTSMRILSRGYLVTFVDIP